METCIKDGLNASLKCFYPCKADIFEATYEVMK